jgi:hypothetical protein
VYDGDELSTSSWKKTRREDLWLVPFF